MKLGITALSIDLPPTSVQYSRIGSFYPKTYLTLREPAGWLSRPPLWFGDDGTDGYRVAVAGRDKHAPDMASDVIAKMLHLIDADPVTVHTVMHCQATLNEQLLASSCLRIQHDHFSAAEMALTLGQMGTSGFMTGLKLARLQLQRHNHGAVALSASDKWVAPFARRFGTVAAFSDAAGCCLLESISESGSYLAEVLEIATAHLLPPTEFWRASDAQRADHLTAAAVMAIRKLIATSGYPLSKLDGIWGEPYGLDIPLRVRSEMGMANQQDEPDIAGSHESSAAPLASLARAQALATEQQRSTMNVVWSASLSGHAGAILVRCNPLSTAGNGSMA